MRGPLRGAVSAVRVRGQEKPVCADEGSGSSSKPVEQFGLKRCPHCEHEIKDPVAAVCLYCGLPLRDPTESLVLLEIPRGLLRVLAAKALDSGKSGWPLVRVLRTVCLDQDTEDVARWAAWLVLSTLMGETCFDWTQPETFIRQIAQGEVDFDRLRDSSRCGFSVKRFYADGSPHQVFINGSRLTKLPDAMRQEAEIILGRYSTIEPERMQELREKLANSMMHHQRTYWVQWERVVLTTRWLWWSAFIILVLMFLVWVRFFS